MTVCGWRLPPARRDPSSTTWSRQTACRTGRSALCTSTRSPAPWCRPAPTGRHLTSARSVALSSRSMPAAPSSRSRPSNSRRSRSRPATLDGAVDATLTTGSSKGVDRGARYVAKCGNAVKEGSGLPVEVQFEPPRDLDVIDEVARPGHRLGRHPRRDVRPAGARPGGSGQGAHRDRALLRRVGAGRRRCSARAKCRRTSSSAWARTSNSPSPAASRAIDMGVYPFVVPLRPVAGSLMQDAEPPSAGLHQQRLSAGGVLHGPARDGRQHGVGRLRALPGMLGDEQPPNGDAVADVARQS